MYIRIWSRRFSQLLCFLLILVCNIYAYALDNAPPLKVAIDVFFPPFTMNSGQNIYGFDISTMNSVCQFLKRECQYERMDFKDILPSVVSGKVDVAISALIVTVERAQRVNFSLPYLLSYIQFLGPVGLKDQSIDANFLKHKKVGIVTDSSLEQALSMIGGEDITVVYYDSISDMLFALQNKVVDVVLINAATAAYWEAQSDGSLAVLGKPFTYGFGFGIAVNANDPALLQAINQALLQYQNDGDFVKNYNEFIGDLGAA
jgi:polar amino acid transport system substrate-binding protein